MADAHELERDAIDRDANAQLRALAKVDDNDAKSSIALAMAAVEEARSQAHLVNRMTFMQTLREKVTMK